MFFPQVYDTKYIAQILGEAKGGLNKFADRYEIKRVGIAHQGGSDSYVTGEVFRIMGKRLKNKFGDTSKLKNCLNVIYGLGASSYSCEKYLPDIENLKTLVENIGDKKTKLDLSKEINNEVHSLNSRKKFDGNIHKNSLDAEA